MPAFIPIPQTVRVSMVMLLDAQKVVNTFHFSINTGVDLTKMQALATAMHTWYTASYKPNLSTAIALSEINVVDLSSQTGPAFTLSISPVEPGTAGISPMPGNVAWCASLRTALRGRNYRGRLYVPGLSSNEVTFPNTILVGVAGAIQTALAQLMTPANVANFIYVVASRFLNKLPRASGVTNTITAIAGDLTLDSQRRRLPGRGA